MNKKHKKRLDAAASATMLLVLMAIGYLGWRAWDYWSAESVYDRLADGAVRYERTAGVGDRMKSEDDKRNREQLSGDGMGVSAGTSHIKTDAEHGSSRREPKNAVLYDDIHLSDMPVINWEEMCRAGKDIVAWLEIPAIGIRYPVVQGEDNAYYLHHLPNGEYKKAGSLFMEASNDPDLGDVNTIIYGHNMNNGSMFGKFRSMTQEDYERNPYIWLCTQKKTCLYSICSIHISQVDDASFTLFGRGLGGDSRTLVWILSEHARSYLDTPVPQGAGGHMLTLSTCATMSDERRVLQGILVAEYMQPKEVP